MIDIIIATHGNLAEGLKDAVSLVVGEQENLECIGLRHEDSIDTFIENVKELAQRTENDVLFLTDLLGASPYNATAQAMNHCKNKKIVSVSGVNLPMVIEAVFKRDTMEVTELADNLVEIASQGIAKLAFEL